MNKVIVFYIRAFNDLDHFTPIIDKLLSNGCKTILYLTTENVPVNDYRLRYLSNYNNCLVKRLSDLNYTYLYCILKRGSLKTKYCLIKEFLHKYFTKLNVMAYSGNQPDLVSVLSIDRHFKEFIEFDEIVICVDHNINTYTLELISYSKKKNIEVFGLPHGDANYYSVMGGPVVNYDLDLFLKRKYLEIFDTFILPNKYMYERQKYELITENQNKIAILGSPRFNKTWVHKHLEIVNNYIGFKRKEDGTVVLIFMKFHGWPIHFEELLVTISLIANFPNTALYLKFHTRLSKLGLRNSKNERLKKCLRKYDNITCFYDDVPSALLISNADIIVDLGTSASFESIILNKTIITLDYLHPDYTTIAYFFKNADLKCRDQLYEVLKRVAKNKNYRTYTDEEQQTFIDTMLHYPDSNVLDRYIKLILSGLHE